MSKEAIREYLKVKGHTAEYLIQQKVSGEFSEVRPFSKYEGIQKAQDAWVKEEFKVNEIKDLICQCRAKLNQLERLLG